MSFAQSWVRVFIAHLLALIAQIRRNFLSGESGTEKLIHLIRQGSKRRAILSTPKRLTFLSPSIKLSFLVTIPFLQK